MYWVSYGLLLESSLVLQKYFSSLIFCLLLMIIFKFFSIKNSPWFGIRSMLFKINPAIVVASVSGMFQFISRFKSRIGIVASIIYSRSDFLMILLGWIWDHRLFLKRPLKYKESPAHFLFHLKSFIILLGYCTLIFP